jgi:rhodanese-related sulfurtransferase
MNKITMKHMREIFGSTEEVILINVLPKQSYLEGHIPGSINIPLTNKEDFVQRIEKVVPSKHQKIVLYCANEQCTASRSAAKLLEEKGFSYVMVFTGGMEEWKEATGKIEKGKHALTR